MKKIVILTSGLTHGGVNRSLLNFLNVMSNREYEFVIFSIYSFGPYYQLFKDYNLVTVLDLFCLFRWIRPIALKDTRLGNAVRRMSDFVVRLFLHVFHKKTAKVIANALSKRGVDVVISFQEGVTTEIASLVDSKKRIAWVHCDYSRYVKETHKDEEAIYKRYSKIVCVSFYTASMFRLYVPEVRDRVVAIHNIMDSAGIKKMSLLDLEIPFDTGVFNLVSVGRIDSVKRFSYIPTIAKRLKDYRIAFRWYLIGDGGSEKEKILSGIKDNFVDDVVVLLGECDNPYPYIKNADALVCLSSSEACPNVINEAKILHTPIVTTDFPSVSEYVNDGDCGVVVKIDEVHTAIRELFLDHSLYKKIKATISTFEYDNKSIVLEIEKVINI